eukprot:12864275-Heterocapsa_arctica.AAC.1
MCIRDSLRTLLVAHHPVVQMMTFSMSAWWALRLITLADTIFGSMAVTAMFLERTSVSADSDP